MQGNVCHSMHVAIRGQLQVSVLTFHLETGLLFVHQVIWSMIFQGFSCLRLQFHQRSSGITDVNYMPGFMFILEMQDQVLLPEQQELYSLSHLPDPLLIF